MKVKNDGTELYIASVQLHHRGTFRCIAKSVISLPNEASAEHLFTLEVEGKLEKLSFLH